MNGLNVVCLQGRLTADPIMRSTQNGTAVCSFTVAVDRVGKDAGTDFINCVAWKGSAEFVSRYFTKGKEIVVNGHLQTRSYEDKNGNKRTATEVVCSNVFFTGSKGDSSSAPQFAELDADDGDLPF